MNTMRSAWLLLALALLAGCVALGILLGWRATGVIAVVAVLPDAALIGAFANEGRLRPGRVRFYNLMHKPQLALLLIGVGLVILLAWGAWAPLAAGAAWLLHIAADRACGFGLREPDGSVEPVGRSRRSGELSRRFAA